jgi:ribosomal protein L11 methylase PrmA
MQLPSDIRSDDRNMQLPSDTNMRINSTPDNTQPTPWVTHANTNTEKTFLEDLIQSLKKDMKETQNEMRDFKHNISQQVAQLQLPQLWQQNINKYQHPVQMEQKVAHNQMQHAQVNQQEVAAIPIHPQQVTYQQAVYRQPPM